MIKKNKPTHVWGIAGLITGMIGFLLVFFAFQASIVFFILAIVFSMIQKKYESTNAATAGLIIGIVGIIFYVIIGCASFGGPYSESGR